MGKPSRLQILGMLSRERNTEADVSQFSCVLDSKYNKSFPSVSLGFVTVISRRARAVECGRSPVQQGPKLPDSAACTVDNSNVLTAGFDVFPVFLFYF